jgi:hypothetical protein
MNVFLYAGLVFSFIGFSVFGAAWLSAKRRSYNPDEWGAMLVAVSIMVAFEIVAGVLAVIGLLIKI